MLNLRNQRGSITLFVLVSCLFFMATVTSAQMYMHSKKVAVDREYKQIKANYEKTNEISIEFVAPKKTTQNSKTVVAEDFTINATDYEDIKTIKYGWLYSSDALADKSSQSISDWVFVENSVASNEITATKDFGSAGYYYLCVVINGKEVWSNTTVKIS